MDIYFNPAYGKLYEKIENASCEVFDYKCEYGSVRNIFLKRRIPFDIGSEYFDIITPYGYGGPVITESVDTDKLMEQFSAEWKSYCAENNIVSEFVRFHLYDNVDVRERYYGEATFSSDNIVVNTTYSPDEMWMRFEHKVRKNVKKARANELTMIRDNSGEYLEDFLRIYYDTMERNNATSYYYFERSYFEEICENLKGEYMFFHAVKDGKIVSTELVLHSDKYAYSFLGGTDTEYYDFRPNDLLKYDIISWCGENGIKAFVLGGGYHKEDGIYKYKKCFAPDGDVPFYVGRTIHNKEVYDRLVELRKEQGDFDEESGFFPLYRV